MHISVYFHDNVSFLWSTQEHANFSIWKFLPVIFNLVKKCQPALPCQHPMHSMVKRTCFHTADTIHNFSYPIFVNLCTYLHCKPLQGNYRVELLHREIPVIITRNEFTEYNFPLFWLHFFPCFDNIEIVALVPVICTGNCQFILQGFKDCFNTL